MRFLLDANLPRSAAEPFRARGHDVADVRDIGLGSASDAQIADHARAEDRFLVTRDFDFADVRNYAPATFRGILVVSLPDGSTAGEIKTLLATFLDSYALGSEAPGSLLILQRNRLRVRRG